MSPCTTLPERKELLRTLIDHVTVAVVCHSELVDVTVTWAGGHQTRGQAVRPVARLDQLSYFPRLLLLVTDLAAAGHGTRAIADRLNAEGLGPPKRTARFGPSQVLTLMNQHAPHPRGQVSALSALGPDEWTVTALATTLQMPTASVYNWIYRGWINAKGVDGQDEVMPGSSPASSTD